MNARESFQSATPFPHLALAQFARKEALLAAAADWPAKDAPGWKAYRDNKFAISDWARLPESIADLLRELNGQETLDRLESITGISRLLADETLSGAGLHEVRLGGKLNMHIDFNRLGPLYRRLNLLIYLNPIWKPEWGGCLRLGKQREITILPELGTTVIFETTQDSWHGHPEPLIGPLVRRSIALYYYTREAPRGHARDLITTHYE